MNKITHFIETHEPILLKKDAYDGINYIDRGVFGGLANKSDRQKIFKEYGKWRNSYLERENPNPKPMPKSTQLHLRLDEDLIERIDISIPKGMSRNEFIKRILNERFGLSNE